MANATQSVGDVPQCPVCGQYMHGPHSCQTSAVFQAQPVSYTVSPRVRDALVRIAADHEYSAGGHRKWLSRAEQTTLAREVCLSLGWSWAR